MDLKCRNCGSEKMMTDLKVLDYGGHFDKSLRAEVAVDNPDAFLFKSAVFAKLNANICGECGHAELFAEDPAALYAAYLKTREYGG